MIKANLTDNNYYLPNKTSLSSEKAKLYFSRRKYLKTLIKTIHKKISVNSQSYFLTLFLMDIIFLNDNLEKIFYEHFPMRTPFPSSKDIQLNNYILLSLVCLMISYKFHGNHSIIYSMNNLVKIIHYISDGNFGFTPNDLIVGEACVIKILKYKLNFYTVYHYLVFFFAHGIIFKKILKKNSNQEKKILEKIYIKARDMIDYIVDKEEYFELYNGKQNYIIVCQILKWSIENVLNFKLKDNENIFNVIYNIKITDTQKKKFLEIINGKNKEKKADNIYDVKKTNDRLKRESTYSLNKNYKGKNITSHYYNISTIDINNYDNNDNYEYFHKHNQSINNVKKTNMNNSNSKNNLTINKHSSMKLSINNKELETTSKLYNSKNEIKDETKKGKEPLDNQKYKKNKQGKIKEILLEKDKNKKKENPFSTLKTNHNKKNYEDKNFKNEFVFNIGESELKQKERIKKPKAFNNSIKMNNNSNNNNYITINTDYCSPSNITNKIIYFKSLKAGNQNIKCENLNKTLDLEPKDSSRRKNCNNNLTKNNIINNNNHPNTIIINNNMHINTFINNNTNFHNNNVVSEILRLTNLNESYKMNPPIINITLNNHS